MSKITSAYITRDENGDDVWFVDSSNYGCIEEISDKIRKLSIEYDKIPEQLLLLKNCDTLIGEFIYGDDDGINVLASFIEQNPLKKLILYFPYGAQDFSRLGSLLHKKLEHIELHVPNARLMSTIDVDLNVMKNLKYIKLVYFSYETGIVRIVLPDQDHPIETIISQTNPVFINPENITSLKSLKESRFFYRHEGDLNITAKLYSSLGDENSLRVFYDYRGRAISLTFKTEWAIPENWITVANDYFGFNRKKYGKSSIWVDFGNRPRRLYFSVNSEMMGNVYIKKNLTEIYIKKLSFLESVKNFLKYEDGTPVTVVEVSDLESVTCENVRPNTFQAHRVSLR